MPMTDSGMSDAIKAAITGKKGAPDNAGELQDFCDALGMAIVEYIKSNALVNVTLVTAGTDSATGTVT